MPGEHTGSGQRAGVLAALGVLLHPLRDQLALSPRFCQPLPVGEHHRADRGRDQQGRGASNAKTYRVKISAAIPWTLPPYVLFASLSPAGCPTTALPTAKINRRRSRSRRSRPARAGP